MENIRQAVEKARSDHAARPERRGRPDPTSSAIRSSGIEPRHRELKLSGKHLLSKRIIAHDTADHRARAFDMLRTQILREMDLKGWHTLGVTSPTPGCGKTVTAINLALSITRQPERSVLLADMDLRKPQVASCLGLLQSEEDLIGVLDGRFGLADALVEARIGDHRLTVLPTESVASNSSELMASDKMAAMLHQIKRDYQSRTVILDLPPVLSGDDVIAVLPQIDCVLLVVAAGSSTLSQIKECAKHLQSTDVVRVVLSKATDPGIHDYYGHYGSRPGRPPRA